MREPILKAVAMPPRVFWAPMLPMVANFSVQMAIMVMLQGAFPGTVNPIMFIFTFVAVHVVLVMYGVKEPHMSKIMQAQGPFIKFYKKVYRSRGKKLAS
jgi:hypothetical protein